MRLARRTDPAHETALQVVLDRLTGGVSERSDTPDGWITAVRALRWWAGGLTFLEQAPLRISPLALLPMVVESRSNSCQHRGSCSRSSRHPLLGGVAAYVAQLDCCRAVRGDGYASTRKSE